MFTSDGLRFCATEISNKQNDAGQCLLNISFLLINTESILTLIASFH